MGESPATTYIQIKWTDYSVEELHPLKSQIPNEMVRTNQNFRISHVP